MNRKDIIKDQTIKIRVDEDLKIRIIQLCQKNHLSMSKFIRELIEET